MSCGPAMISYSCWFIQVCVFFEYLGECSLGFTYVCVAAIDVTCDVIDGSTLVFHSWSHEQYILYSSMLFYFEMFPVSDTRCLSVIPYSTGLSCPGPVYSSDMFSRIFPLTQMFVFDS